jgi:hypothetical protein
MARKRLWIKGVEKFGVRSITAKELLEEVL